jgi:Fur family transcriptional regulator, ferric uptake regulator
MGGRSSSSANELHTSVAARLGRLDQRYTRNRRALIDVLQRAGGPVTIEEIMAGDADLALSSTYRNLALLGQAGVVHRVATGDDHARYELAELLTGHHHHHLVCSSCGTVTDFTLTEDLETSLGRALDLVARDAAFATDHHRLDLVGTCDACR